MTLYSARRKIQTKIEDVLGVNIRRRSHGARDWFDIGRSGCVIKTIFDVGANIGQSAIKFLDSFPNPTIYCFEPVQETFGELVRNVGNSPNVHCHQNAMGSRECVRPIYLTGESLCNSLIMPSAIVGTEDVSVLTVDGFASKTQLRQ